MPAKVTIFIGNGFDLNLGLRTKYTHFLEEYTQKQKSDNDNITALKKI